MMLKTHTIKLNEVATLPVSDVAGLILDKFAEEAYKMKEINTAREVMDIALHTVSVTNDVTLFPIREDACYFIAHNPDEAAETFEKLKVAYTEFYEEFEDDDEPSDFLNPYKQPISFAKMMVQYEIQKVVRAYCTAQSLDTEKKINLDEVIDVFDLASKYNKCKVLNDICEAKQIDVEVPHPERVNFDNMVVNCYPTIAKILAEAPDGSYFDDVVYNNQKNPNFSIFFASSSLEEAIWACLTQDAPMIGSTIKTCINTGRTAFDENLSNPIKGMREIESAYIVDRILIALSCDLDNKGINMVELGEDSFDYVVDDKSKKALLELADEEYFREGLEAVVHYSKTWPKLTKAS